VQCDRATLGGDPAVLAADLRALVPAPESVQDVVADIIARVRATGDDALRYYTRQYDTGGAQPAALRVPEAELDTAVEQLDPAVRSGLERAIGNVRRVAQAALRSDRAVQFDGHEVILREVPVDRAGLYVPGGRAPYPSTVVMGTVTARVAGVPEIAVCAPPGRDGDVDHVVLAACRLAGASVVYRMGGAQAIAALAFGTETVTPVDVIVGPGNLYVQEAKRQVFGAVGIDGFAGPSDLVVIAGADADPGPLALDLLAQAEHGPGTLVIGISESSELLAELSALLQDAPDTGAVARLVDVRDLDQALALSTSSWWVRDSRRWRRASRAPGACSSEPTAPRHSATTSPARTTFSPPMAQRGSHRRCRRRISAAASQRSGSAAGLGNSPAWRLRWLAQRASSCTPARWRRAFGTMASMTRSAEIERRTAETEIHVSLALDGDGAGTRDSGVGFLDHMLDLLARHGRLDLDLRARGDLQTGAHHTVEDVGICIGQALDQALGDRAGISRYGQATVPMDESRVSCAIDISGRGLCVFEASLPPGSIGNFDHELTEEFFRALATNAKFTLHITVQTGSNAHHVIEAMFKALARALRTAVALDPTEPGVPSTKGTLV